VATVHSHRVTTDIAQSHVMVVEDDRDTREVVRLILELEGMDVSEAADGFEALARLHKLREANPHRPCAVVLDIMMPRCSGAEFRKRQLDDPLIANVPIIVLSAIADQLRADDLHAFAKVPKPFDPDQLVTVVRQACLSNAET
jgi:CheY-like chemotaxis protein